MARRLSLIFLALSFIALAATASGADPALVAHWNFSEGAGNILHDRSGSNSGKG